MSTSVKLLFTTPDKIKVGDRVISTYRGIKRDCKVLAIRHRENLYVLSTDIVTAGVPETIVLARKRHQIDVIDDAQIVLQEELQDIEELVDWDFIHFEMI